jgi:hypothetical protein
MILPISFFSMGWPDQTLTTPSCSGKSVSVPPDSAPPKDSVRRERLKSLKDSSFGDTWRANRRIGENKEAKPLNEKPTSNRWKRNNTLMSTPCVSFYLPG